jgi:tryptophan 7-halogenase
MKLKNITIVGGGTSAWLTAAYLFKNNPDIGITVVDKEIGNPIGVGEATLLNFRSFLEECGFDVEDWLIPLSAGYKAGIVFTNWTKPGNDVWHPFYKGNRILPNEERVWDIWSLCQTHDFKEYATGFYDSAVKHNTVDDSNRDLYGYHVDCGKLVLFLQKHLENKIRVVRSEVVHVDIENDIVKQLTLLNGDIITSELFVDCTGFKQVLRTPKLRNNLEGRLFVNTAVVGQIPYENRPEEFKPYAVCDATDHGWLWKIGVSNRIGSGMVFNRDITDIEEAKDYFVNYWNNRIPKEKVRAINWDPYYIEDQWAGNVVNIGLSAGFVEPLESTGIALITVGATQLSSAIAERWITDANRDNFNLQMNILFEDIVDFVSMHYANNTRKTKFWSYVKETFTPSARMLHYIDELKNSNIRLPFKSSFNHMFGGANWSIVLIQMGFDVAPRNISFSKETASEILVDTYIKYEKNRHVMSRHHSSEIDRVLDISKL